MLPYKMHLRRRQSQNALQEAQSRMLLVVGSVVHLQCQCLKNGCYDVENVTLDLGVLIFVHITQKQQTDMGTFKCLHGKSFEEDSGNGKSRHGGQCKGPQEGHSGYWEKTLK